MIKFKTQPACEVCKENEATAFSYMGGFAEDRKWKFTCPCATNSNAHREALYSIPIDRFFSSPSATVDWMAHLQEKNWMNCADFMQMIQRFRRATGSFGSTFDGARSPGV